MDRFREIFEALEDPRQPNAQRHDLLEILMIAFCASLCGAESGVDMAAFGRAKQAVLREFLTLEHGIPSHDTFSRVFRVLDPAQFQVCFVRYLEAFQLSCKGHVAIDGKALRGAQDKAVRSSPLYMVNAFASETGLTLGQVSTEDKSNEIPAVRALLELLCLKECTVTLDALHAQKETAQAIIKQDADYVMALKGNQRGLYEDVVLYLDDPQSAVSDTHRTCDADHGRIDERQAVVCHDIDWLLDRHDWPGLKGIGKITAVREIDEKKQEISRYYLLSRVMDAGEFLDLARAHWRIENSLHWVLDVVMKEDASRARKDNAPQNLAVLRRLALNVIKANKDKGSNRVKFKQAGWDDSFLRKLIAGC